MGRGRAIGRPYFAPGEAIGTTSSAPWAEGKKLEHRAQRAEAQAEAETHDASALRAEGEQLQGLLDALRPTAGTLLRSRCWPCSR